MKGSSGSRESTHNGLSLESCRFLRAYNKPSNQHVPRNTSTLNFRFNMFCLMYLYALCPHFRYSKSFRRPYNSTIYSNYLINLRISMEHIKKILASHNFFFNGYFNITVLSFRHFFVCRCLRKNLFSHMFIIPVTNAENVNNIDLIIIFF